MVHFYFRLTFFLIGVILGIYIGFHQFGEQNNSILKRPLNAIKFYEIWFKNHSLRRKSVLWDTVRYADRKIHTESEFLSIKFKILCMILVHKKKNVKPVGDTFARGCNNVTYIYLNDKPKKIMPIKRTKENSPWVILCSSLRAVPMVYDWILIINDNTFAIVENLRYLIAPLNSSEKHYLGYAVEFWNTIYNSNEAGYVLSKGTLISLKESLSKTNCTPNIYWNKEDLYLGRLLASLNVTPTDTRDAEGLSTFHPYNWFQAFFPGEHSFKPSYFPVKCCSKHSVTFQAIEGDKMYLYHYLLYELQLFMYGNLGNKAPIDKPDDMVWKSFLKERNIHDFNISTEEYYKIWEALIDNPNSFASNMKRESNFDYD